MPNPYVDLELSYPAQPGLEFDVTAQLQGDQRCLSVGETFFCEWFPCSAREVSEKFAKAMQGVLSGDARPIEHHRNGKVLKAQIQLQQDESWITVATWSKLRRPSFAKKTIRIRQNRGVTAL
jgi:hypothetical protein